MKMPDEGYLEMRQGDILQIKFNLIVGQQLLDAMLGIAAERFDCHVSDGAANASQSWRWI